ncbi:hypothetical protein D3C73_1143910 [compost metagenome]
MAGSGAVSDTVLRTTFCGSFTSSACNKRKVCAPAAQMTMGARTLPCSVCTPHTLPPATSRALTPQSSSTTAPAPMAARAKARVARVGSAWPSDSAMMPPPVRRDTIGNRAAISSGLSMRVSLTRPPASASQA